MNLEWKIRGVDVLLKDVEFDHDEQTANYSDVLHNGGCICALLSKDDEAEMAREIYQWHVNTQQNNADEQRYERLQTALELW
jgi:hypothetical protein